MPDDLQAEVERLRAQVEDYRQRELDDLRRQLAAALSDVDHYRTEAQRNAQLGREIAAEAERERAEMLSKLRAYEKAQVSVKRFGS